MQAAKCKLGLHEWGQWEYATSYEDEIPKTCRARRKCVACGAADLREDEDHIWSEWRYLHEGDCAEARSCSRCGAKERGEASHRWSEWQRSAASGCDEARSCRHCGATESRKDHAWGGWSGDERSCTACEAKEKMEKFELCKEAGRCEVCQRNFGPGEGYSVPVSAFYNCERYREWLESSPSDFATTFAGGIDHLLIDEMCCDGRTCCAVCKGCISMFL